MKNIVKITIAALSVCSAAAVGIGAYAHRKAEENKLYPEKYIAENYPDAEIIKTGMEYDMFGFVDTGFPVYYCRDTKTGTRFSVTFAGDGSFGRMKVLKDDYSSQQTSHSFADELIEEAEKHLKAEHLCLHDPYTECGIVIITKNERPENISWLINALNKRINHIWQNDSTYMMYDILDCSEGLFEKMKQLDWQAFDPEAGNYFGFNCAANISGWHSEMITKKLSEAFDVRTFLNRGDADDELYKPPESFEDTVIEIEGEPNDRGKPHLWVYGVNYHK